MLQRLERNFGGYAIPNLTQYLLAGQVFFFLIAPLQQNLTQRMAFIPNEVLAGEWWRILAFPFMPPFEPRSGLDVFFAFFWFWLFYVFGTTLEYDWGRFKYNVYLLIAFVATIAAAFIDPDAPATNSFITLTIFLAFAYLNPEFTLHLFFILPVPIKYLAWLTWFGIGIVVLTGNVATQLGAIASVLNFLLFFGGDLLNRSRGASKRMSRQAEAIRDQSTAFHTCEQCGVTDKTNPEREFRYHRVEGETKCLCDVCGKAG